MAVLIGNIGPFDEKSEKFSDYADRFEAYVAANDIDNDKKVNVFLVVIGPDAYKLLKNLCDPEIRIPRRLPGCHSCCKDTLNQVLFSVFTSP